MDPVLKMAASGDRAAPSRTASRLLLDVRGEVAGITSAARPEL
jgi:hypothetical protein